MVEDWEISWERAETRQRIWNWAGIVCLHIVWDSFLGLRTEIHLPEAAALPSKTTHQLLWQKKQIGIYWRFQIDKMSIKCTRRRRRRRRRKGSREGRVERNGEFSVWFFLLLMDILKIPGGWKCDSKMEGGEGKRRRGRGRRKKKRNNPSVWFMDIVPVSTWGRVELIAAVFQRSTIRAHSTSWCWSDAPNFRFPVSATISVDCLQEGREFYLTTEAFVYRDHSRNKDWRWWLRWWRAGKFPRKQNHILEESHAEC